MEETKSIWQCNDDGYFGRIKRLREIGYLADCVFVVGPDPDKRRKFHCHKLILVLISPVFERMFLGEFKESTSKEIVLDDIEWDAFENFLDFIYYHQYQKYTNIINLLSFESLKNLMLNAKKYMIIDTEKLISRFKEKMSTLEFVEIIDILEFIYLIDNKELLYWTESMIQNRSNTNKGYEILNCSHVYDLSPSIFYQFICMITERVENLARFNAIEIYAKVNASTFNKYIDEVNSTAGSKTFEKKENTHKESKINEDEVNAIPDVDKISDNNEDTDENILQKMIASIDFKRMLKSEFLNGPWKSNLLNLNEKQKILDTTVFSTVFLFR